MTVGAIEQPVFATYPSLRGRTAFLSGGASGLGAEFVSQLAGQGARVAFIDIDLDRGEALEQALRDDGADALFAECDVPTAAPDDTSSEQLPRPSGLDAAAATCSPPRTNSRCSGPI